VTLNGYRKLELGSNEITCNSIT